MKLLSIDNAKTIKGEKFGYRTAILYLAPHKLAGGKSVCPNSTEGCRSTCLFFAGRARMFKHIADARKNRTLLYWQNRPLFLALLHMEIETFLANCNKAKMVPAIRLDGTSDLGLASIFAPVFPSIQFYDYTKNPKRMLAYANGEYSPNWHLTFSYSEKNLKDCLKFLKMGKNVAIPFVGSLPTTFLGYGVVAGDDNDLRFLNLSSSKKKSEGSIIGLRAKGTLEKRSIGLAFKFFLKS